MMKLAYPIGLGLTAFAGLPAAMTPQSLQGSTEEALASTLAAIDEMLVISKAVERREPGSIERVLDATEPVAGQPAKQDEFLSQLRLELSELQQKIDLQAQMKTKAEAETAPKAGPSNALQRPRSEPQKPQTEPLPEGQLEPRGYSADALRQGRLLFRDGRFDEAIKVLSAIDANPEAAYWEARSYESLGQPEQAIRRYNALIDDPKDESIARRAAHDLSFLEWKQRYYGAENK